jgi:hypothetical protein
VIPASTPAWLIGSFLLAFFAFCLLCNLVIVYRRIGRSERPSLILIAGGLAGMGAFLLLPVARLHRWFWLPLIVDLAVPYSAAFLLPWILGQPRKRRRR